MNRRGVALLLVLWLLVLLTGLAALSLGGARIGSAAGRNRTALLRAGWAREACLEILLGKAANHSDRWQPESLSIDSMDLGDGVWCRADVSDPGERMNLNLASRDALLELVGDSNLVDRMIRRRPWPAIAPLLELPEVIGDPRWLELLTVRGTGRINLNRAPPEVLQTLPDVDPEGASALVRSRALRPAFRSIEEAVRALPPGTMQRVLNQYQPFATLVTVESEQLIVKLSGRVRDGPLVAGATITLVPAGTRLAVIRRETE